MCTSRVCLEKNNQSLNVLLPVIQAAFWSYSCAMASLTEMKSSSSPSPTTSWWTYIPPGLEKTDLPGQAQQCGQSKGHFWHPAAKVI